MAGFFKGGRGGSKFGTKRPWKGGGFNDRGGDRGFERKEMHDAVCSTCGNDCQVPFRPNGTKPVLCRNCFKPNETRTSFGDKRPYTNDRSFGNKRSFGEKRSFDRPAAGPSMDTKKIESRLGAIEEKLDALLEALAGKEA